MYLCWKKESLQYLQEKHHKKRPQVALTRSTITFPAISVSVKLYTIYTPLLQKQSSQYNPPYKLSLISSLLPQESYTKSHDKIHQLHKSQKMI